MLDPPKRLAITLLGVGSAVAVVPAAIVGFNEGGLFVMLGAFLVVAGTWFLATAKGHTPLWCLLGLVGVLIVLALPDKYPTPTTHPPKRRRKRPRVPRGAEK